MMMDPGQERLSKFLLIPPSLSLFVSLIVCHRVTGHVTRSTDRIKGESGKSGSRCIFCGGCCMTSPFHGLSFVPHPVGLPKRLGIHTTPGTTNQQHLDCVASVTLATHAL